MTPHLLAEAAARLLGPVTADDLGFGPDTSPPTTLSGLQWGQDPVVDLVSVGRADLQRREFANAALYSLAALAVPLHEWQEIADRGKRAGGAAVGSG